MFPQANSNFTGLGAGGSQDSSLLSGNGGSFSDYPDFPDQGFPRGRLLFHEVTQINLLDRFKVSVGAYCFLRKLTHLAVDLAFKLFKQTQPTKSLPGADVVDLTKEDIVDETLRSIQVFQNYVVAGASAQGNEALPLYVGGRIWVRGIAENYPPELEMLETLFISTDVSKITNINAQDPETKNTLLHVALHRGAIELAMKLIAHPKINVNILNGQGVSPLHLAIVKRCINPQAVQEQERLSKCKDREKRHHKLVKALLEKGADVNALMGAPGSTVGIKPNLEIPGGLDALSLAIFFKCTYLIDELISKGSNVNQRNYLGQTYLMSAAKTNNVSMIKKLLECGADVGAKAAKGWLALDIAIQMGYNQLIPWLIPSEGLNGQAKRRVTSDKWTDSERPTPLVWALLKKTPGENSLNLLETVLILVNYGASKDVTVDPIHLNYPIHIAILKGYTNLIVALKPSAGLNVQNSNGNTPLHLAAAVGNEKAVENLLNDSIHGDQIADIRITNNKGLLPLHKAIIGKKEISIEKLCLPELVNEQDNEGKTPLHYAVVYGKVQNFQFLIDQGADISIKTKTEELPLHLALVAEKEMPIERLYLPEFVNQQNSEGKTPLHFAAIKGRVEHLKFLIDQGANVNIKDKKGRLPLHYVTHSSEVEEQAIRLLLPKEGINAKDSEGNTALHCAVVYKSAETLKSLKKFGADLGIQNNKGELPLHLAIRIWDANYLHLLLLEGRIDELNNEGYSALHLAAKIGNGNAIDALVRAGADLNLMSNQGTLPIHLAAEKGHHQIIRLVIPKTEEGINAKTQSGLTALHLAAQLSEDEETTLLTVQELLENGANSEIPGGIRGDLPFHRAMLTGNRFMTDLLLPKAGINTPNQVGQTGLHAAVRSGKLSLVKYLLRKGASLDVQDDRGYFPLFDVVRLLKRDLIPILIPTGGINQLNKDNNSALHFAASMGHERIVKILVLKGASKETRNKNGDLPLHIAASKGQQNVISNLIPKEGVNVRNINEATPLHLAASTGNRETIKVLLENGADVDALDEDGNTALHLAAINGDRGVVEELIKANANIYRTNREDRSALKLAIINGHRDIALIMLEKEGAEWKDVKDILISLALEILNEEQKADMIHFFENL